jgi:hypothetical protein
MKCPNCNNDLDIKIDGGICILTYVFCSSNCLFKYFTLEQIKQLYYIENKTKPKL